MGVEKIFKEITIENLIGKRYICIILKVRLFFKRINLRKVMFRIIKI